MVEHRPGNQETHPKPGEYKIDGIPNMLRKHPLWCGWTTASQLVQYHGYRDLAPEKLFSFIHGNYDPTKESWITGSSPKPTADTMAEAIKGMTDLLPRIAAKKDFDDMRDRNPDLATPHDVLQRFIKAKRPCIVRVPGHFLITSGMDLNTQKYMFLDSKFGRVVTFSFEQFDRDWKQYERGYNRDTSYLMLTIAGRKKTPQA